MSEKQGESIMNSAEHAELEKLNENPVLISALKKIFLAGIYQNGTLDKDKEPDFRRNYALGLSFDKSGNEFSRDNEALGAALRACNEAMRVLGVGFDSITKYKKIMIFGTPATS